MACWSLPALGTTNCAKIRRVWHKFSCVHCKSIIFFSHQKMASRIDLDNLCITSLLPLSINYEEITEFSKVFVVCSCLSTTQSHLYLLLTFFQTHLVAFCTFFFVCSPVAHYPTQICDSLDKYCLHASSLCLIQWGIDFLFFFFFNWTFINNSNSILFFQSNSSANWRVSMKIIHK